MWSALCKLLSLRKSGGQDRLSKMRCTVNIRAAQSDGQMTLKQILPIGKQDNLGVGEGLWHLEKQTGNGF